MTVPSYAFLPWLRRGAARGLAAPVAVSAGGRAMLELTVDVNGQPVPVPLSLYGPGDIASIDPRLVRAVEPARGVREAEPYAFAAIELALPDLPWLLSPFAPDADGRLEPWLALVVVRADASAIVAGGPGLPRLELARAAGELPPPEEAWAWAHVQVAGGIDRALDAILADEPHRVTARVVAPRRLDPGVAWRAVLVPRYAAGRAAGLGEPAPAAPLAFAWDPTSTAAVSLPVYHAWEFSTAADADLETLARRIEARELPPEVGRLPVDFRTPGGDMRGIAATLTVEGALVATIASEPLPDAADDAVGDLATAIDRGGDPLVVAPPLYGGAQVDEHVVPVGGWLRELNLDPRLRAIAGLGAEAVRRDQEALVAAAWDQLGEVRDANRRLGWLVLAAEVAGALHRKHFARLSAASLAAVTAPAHPRLRLHAGAPTTLHAEIRTRLAIASVVAPVSRRALRPAGRVARSMRGPAATATTTATARTVGRAALGLVHAVLATPATGLVTFGRVFAALGRPAALARLGPDRLNAAMMAAAPRPNGFFAVDEHGRGFQFPAPFVDDDSRELRTAAVALHAHLDKTRALAARRRGPVLGAVLAKAELLAATEPGPAFRDVVAARLIVPADTPPRGELDPVRGTPRFPQPTMPALQAISEVLILPALDRVPSNTSSLAIPNQRFVEAFLAGMNHEMERELLWREFPARRGATYFRRFWDTRGRIGGPVDDITDIADWARATDLATHAPQPAAERTVLVLRADLVRRLPSMMIYAVPRTDDGEPDLDVSRERHPVFRGALEPDVIFAGFEIPRDEAKQWFFVLQQRPTAPRFGLDAPPADPSALVSLPQLRNDLSWGHMPVGASHAIVAGPLVGNELRDPNPDDDPTTGPEKAVWGHNAADMAWLTLQLPVRLILPGERMVP